MPTDYILYSTTTHFLRNSHTDIATPIFSPSVNESTRPNQSTNTVEDQSFHIIEPLPHLPRQCQSFWDILRLLVLSADIHKDEVAFHQQCKGKHPRAMKIIGRDKVSKSIASSLQYIELHATCSTYCKRKASSSAPTPYKNSGPPTQIHSSFLDRMSRLS